MGDGRRQGGLKPACPNAMIRRINIIGLTVASAERFSEAANAWSAIEPTPLAMNHLMPATTQEGRFLVAGGGPSSRA